MFYNQSSFAFFFFNDTATTEIYTLSLHDALPILITGKVERYEVPNLLALNFLLHGALDGGGTMSLKTDAQGKVFSTALLRLRSEERRVGKECRSRWAPYH